MQSLLRSIPPPGLLSNTSSLTTGSSLVKTKIFFNDVVISKSLSSRERSTPLSHAAAGPGWIRRVDGTAPFAQWPAQILVVGLYLLYLYRT